MDQAQVLGALAATLQPETNKQATTQLKQMEKIIGFPECLINCLTAPEVPVGVQQCTAIYLKNLLDRFYEQDENEPNKFSIHENDKNYLRNNILECIVKTPDNVRNQLLVIVRKMIKIDYKNSDRWRDGLNENILKLLQNTDNNPHMWLAGLLVLLQLTKVFEYVQVEDTDRHFFMDAMRTFLPVMQSMSENLCTSDDPNAALLQKIILKSFFALSQYKLPIDLFTPENANSWINILKATISQKVPEVAGFADLDEKERSELPHWKAKKWALHVANRLFDKYGCPGKVEDEYEQFAQFFMNNCAKELLSIQLPLLAQKREGQWVSNKVMMLILSYIELGVAHSQTWSVIKGETFINLVKEICFPLMCFSEDDAQLWEEDPEEYVRSKFDIFAECTSAKSAAEDLVRTACKKRKDILNQVMNFAQAELGNLSNQQPETVDGIFNLICSVSDQLMNKKPYKAQLDQLTKMFFIPLCESDQGYLRARGLFCIKSFAEAKLKKQTVLEVFRIAMQLLTTNPSEDQEQDMPVQVEAAMALSRLAHIHQDKTGQFI